MSRGIRIASAAMAAVLGAGLTATAEAQEKRCEMKLIGTLPASTERGSPVVDGAVNGRPTKILADTGAATSLVFRHVATDHGLRIRSVDNIRFFGVDGEFQVGLVSFEKFQLGDYPMGKREFFIVNQGGRADIAMLLGRDLFANADIEFDLAHNAIRLFKPVNCTGKPLAYWGPDYGEVPFKRSASYGSSFVVELMLNDKPVTAEIDSGANTSVLTLQAAARVGLKPGDPGVQEQELARGVAGVGLQTWIGNFASFKIGDETIRNAKLRMAELYGRNTAASLGTRIDRQVFDNPDMLLGADFLRSHRVLISNSQKKVYFSYIGGPVFQLTGPVRADESKAAGATPTAPDQSAKP